MTNWTYKGSTDFEIPLGAFGFVYSIECNLPQDELSALGITKSKYIGRKYLTAAKTTSKRVLAKDGTKITKKKKSRVESNWRDYMGSCKPLLEDIKRLGSDKFNFTILAFGFTKGQVNFGEEFAQQKYGVIFDDTYYNDSIGSGGFRNVKFTSEFKEILKGI